jgi:hypothetical protein
MTAKQKNQTVSLYPHYLFFDLFDRAAKCLRMAVTNLARGFVTFWYRSDRSWSYSGSALALFFRQAASRKPKHIHHR